MGYDNSSLGVRFIMQLIRVVATTFTLVDRNSKGRLPWAGFDLVSKATSRAGQDALRPICTTTPCAIFCPNDMDRPKTAAGRSLRLIRSTRIRFICLG